MAIDTTFTSAAPYFDDWSSGDGNSRKNYLKILFQPGRSVQVRELNQMQSAIQAQIDKLGQGIYTDGTRVLDGELSVDNKVQWVDIKLLSNAANAAADVARPLIGKTIYADSDGKSYSSHNSPNGIQVAAEILDYELIASDEYRFYIRYLTQSVDFDNSSRTQADVKIAENCGSYLTADNAIGTGTDTLVTGHALKMHNKKGVYFVRGYFVEAPEQTKYVKTLATGPDNTLNGKIGFVVTEEAKTAINDSSLYDNATGTPNESAPGADRYTITLTLTLLSDETAKVGAAATTKNVVATTSSTAIDIVSLVDSKIIEPVSTKYSEIGDVLATRTFEESGDYALRPFIVDIREHNNTGKNRGRYTSGGDSSKFVATVEPSIAYVKGRRIELLAKQDITVNKARETHKHQGHQIQAAQGSYIEGNVIDFLPMNDNTTEYTLKTASGGTTIGTCTVRGLEYTGRLYRLYISNLALVAGKFLSEARYIEGAADDDGSATFFMTTPDTEPGFRLEDVKENNSIFLLPESTIKTLLPTGVTSTVIDIPVRKTETTVSVSTNSVVLNVTAPDSFYHDNPNEYIVVDSASGSPAVVESVALSTNSAGLDRATLTLASGHGFSNVDVQYSHRKQGTARDKTIGTASENFPAASYAVGDTITLANDDIVNIVSLSDTPGTDFSSSFQLDDGQTSTSYGVGKLVCTSAVTSTAIKVSYRHFSHGAGDYFSVDSYNNSTNSNMLDSGTIERRDVGFFESMHLLDTLDFRGSSTSLDPNGIINIGAIESYLPRHDKIVLRSSGKVSYLEGDAAGNAPQPTPNDSMKLYDLDIPAFTENVQDIELGYIDNKRYTMRDIGKIARRVTNLEYYSSLSLLEQSTKEKQIFDSNGERFKNGIIVDEFKGHGVGDPSDPGYAIAVEPETGNLRPSFTAADFDIYNTSNTADDNSPAGSTAIGAEDQIRLPATSIETLIDQPFASVDISVNPFDVASWVGELKLSPESDHWRDTTKRPRVLVRQDGTSDAILQIMNETLSSIGTRWGEWKSTWRGEEKVDLGWHTMSGAQRVLSEHGRGTKHTRNCKCGHKNTLRFPTFGGGTDTVTNERRARLKIEQRTNTFDETRTGIQQFAEAHWGPEVSQGERVVDTSFIPFIRSRKVNFHATGLKPNTQVYPFFDDIDISGYTTQKATFTEHRDDTVRVDHTNDSPNNITSSVLKTDSAGELIGVFIIPNNQFLRFATGEREFRLSDRTDNNLTEAETYAKANYSARGIMQTTEETFVSTRQVRISERVVPDSRVTTTTEVAVAKVRHVDPLAQTFLVDPDIYENGVFIKDIDLFFRKKHASLPVRIQIVTTENGIPTQKIIPFTSIEKKPADVNISEDASTATTFVFESPIHLKSGVEYAIVVLSNSPEFRLWHSEVGGTDVGAGGQKITKNPYTGVALKSANASTWTPDQSKDFKFTIRHMKFPTTAKNVGLGSSDTGYGNFIAVLPGASTKVDSVTLFAEQVLLPETQIAYTLEITGPTSSGSASTYNIAPGETIELPETVTVTQADQLILRCALLSNDEFLTPLIDVNSISILTTANTINNSITNEDRITHGAATARYITKTVRLDNAASRLDCYLDVERPAAQCNLHMYARFNDSDTYKKLESAVIPVSNSFQEIHFRTKPSDDSPTAAGQTFDKFQVKIVMTTIGSDGVTADTATIPMARNFRAIATA
tara:strand:- start:5158 stop:10251 length:5094 start_codon:yes stop_codon:yes gene_type:complete